MDVRGGPWGPGRGQNLPMLILCDLAREEICQVTDSVPPRPRQLLLLAMLGFWRWCIRTRDIKDGHDITPAIVKEFRAMLRRSGVEKSVCDLHRDATKIVLKVIAANRGVWHSYPDDYLLYRPTAGEIWEHLRREFGRMYLSPDDLP